MFCSTMIQRRIDSPFSPGHDAMHAGWVRENVARAICEGDRPIQAWRHQRCITIPKLAKLTGIDAGRLMNLEREIEVPTADEFYRLAEALRAPVEMLRR